MGGRRGILFITLLFLGRIMLPAQEPDSVLMVTGVLYDPSYTPVAGSHVINIRSRQGVVSDTLGIFSIPASVTDSLLVRNIAFRDTIIPVPYILEKGYAMLTPRYYPIEEARIFNWGSTYEDFRRAIVAMPNEQTLGESMGLPTQDPGYIPFQMNEELLKSTRFLLHSPLSYFYYNFNRKARSARKLFWMGKNSEKQTIFDDITSPDNLKNITGLTGETLQDFLYFLYGRMTCDLNCTELQIYSEIYSIWEIYRGLSGERPITEREE